MPVGGGIDTSTSAEVVQVESSLLWELCSLLRVTECVGFLVFYFINESEASFMVMFSLWSEVLSLWSHLLLVVLRMLWLVKLSA